MVIGWNYNSGKRFGQVSALTFVIDFVPILLSYFIGRTLFCAKDLVMAWFNKWLAVAWPGRSNKSARYSSIMTTAKMGAIGLALSMQTTRKDLSVVCFTGKIKSRMTQFWEKGIVLKLVRVCSRNAKLLMLLAKHLVDSWVAQSHFIVRFQSLTFQNS